VVFGHTHLQFTREHRGVTLLNPGSVGFPFDGDPRAAWAILGDDGAVELRRVAYDVEAAAAGLADRFGPAPWVEATAARVRAGRFAV
jgi:diadenosine tetraphosphatase ApaH/serine/threonine PP2A family protein phosphatase